MTRTLYIEKSAIENRNQLALSFPDLNKRRIYEESFVWDDQITHFYAIDTDDDEDTLKSICTHVMENPNPPIIMYSGIVDATKIRGVVRMGLCAGYENEDSEGEMLETEVVDLRCQISFPLATKPQREKMIEFIPLKLPLPTTLDTVERRLKSMYVLEGGEGRESDYIHDTVYLLAIATEIYPASLIWKYAKIPDPIARWLNAIRRTNKNISNQKPAYWIMTEKERNYLELYLYIGSESHYGSPFKPMKWVIPPIDTISQTDDESQTQFIDGRELIERINVASSAEDLGSVLSGMKILAASFLGDDSVSGRIINQGETGITVRFSRDE